MSSSIGIAMSLAMTLTSFIGVETSDKPSYLWSSCKTSTESNMYKNNFTVENVFKNGTINLRDYEGQVLLIVNVASYWGLTYQYYALNDLITKFKGRNFTVLGFPCNQFGLQEPAANATELYNGLAWVRPGQQRGYNFVPSFPLTQKLDVNGKDAHPIFNTLKNFCQPPWLEFASSKNCFWEPKHGNDIRWNFEKWLITKVGTPFRRYSSPTRPENLVEDIEYLLGDAPLSPRMQEGDARKEPGNLL